MINYERTIDDEAMSFEENYFFKQGRSHGKTKSKNGGRSTKSKFSSLNPNTFQEINDRKIKHKKNQSCVMKERTEVLKNNQVIDTHTKKEQQLIQKSEQQEEPQNMNQEDIYLWDFADFDYFTDEEDNTNTSDLFEELQAIQKEYMYVDEEFIKKKTLENNLYFINENTIPLEKELVNLQIEKQEIEEDIQFINQKLQGWNNLKNTICERALNTSLEEQVFPNWLNYSNHWTDDLLSGISTQSNYPEWY